MSKSKRHALAEEKHLRKDSQLTKFPDLSFIGVFQIPIAKNRIDKPETGT